MLSVSEVTTILMKHVEGIKSEDAVGYIEALKEICQAQEKATAEEIYKEILLASNLERDQYGDETGGICISEHNLVILKEHLGIK